MDSVVATNGLAFAYGDIVALHGVDLEVPPGLIGLVGANGAGKTTLLRLLLGSLQAAQGTINVMGRRVPAEVLDVRSHIGYMPEGPCLPPDQTAADFMVYAAQLGGLPIRAARQRASDVLTLVGLHEERFRYMGEFSTGMEQRAKFAQAIVHDPDLVLLDEPTAGLDPEGRVEMLELVTRLDEFGINAIVSSHVLTDIERTCEWVVMLDGGRVLRSGPLTDLSVAEEVELEVLDDPGRVATALRTAGADVTVEGTQLSISHPAGDPFEVVRDVLADLGEGVRRLGARRTTLEDIFLGGNEVEDG
jgi:ABC-2 type transport system ATP-binding protein